MDSNNTGMVDTGSTGSMGSMGKAVDTTVTGMGYTDRELVYILADRSDVVKCMLGSVGCNLGKLVDSGKAGGNLPCSYEIDGLVVLADGPGYEMWD